MNIDRPRAGCNKTDAPRFRRLVEHLHSGGPRLVGEYLSQLLKSWPTAPIVPLLEEYRAIDTEQLRKMGADRWPADIVLVPESIRSGRANRGAILRAALQPTDDGGVA